MKGILAVLALGGVLATATASPNAPALEQGFRSGIEAYDAQDWDAAIAAWEGLRRFRVEHPAVEYNLGNAYMKKQDYGRAVLHYERAVRLDPVDEETRANLELVRGLLVDDLGPKSPSVARALETVERMLPIRDSSLLLFVLWQLLGLAVLVAILRPGRLRGMATATAAFAALLILVLAPIVWLQWRKVEDRSRRVVLSPAVEARSGPGEQYTTTFTVHEGLVVTGRETVSGWERVELANGLVGWLPVDSIEPI